MITQVGHTAYAVNDMEAARRYYCDGLGLQEAFQLHKDDGTLWIVYLKTGNGTFIELFPTPGFQPNDANVSYKHLCLLVDDMEATVAEMKARGVEFTSEINRGKDGNTQAWTRDPDGNRIELMQIAPDSLQAQASRS